MQAKKLLTEKISLVTKGYLNQNIIAIKMTTSNNSQN